MKKFAKVALVLMCAVALVVCSILGTLAYLKSTTQVTKNTFTVGNVAISLDEEEVNVYGESQGTRTTEGNEYKLIAGHTYTKDPTVTVAADSEESYVRMIVTINKIEALKKACGIDAADPFLPQNFVSGWDNSIWVSTEQIKDDGDTCTYEFRYHETVSTVGAGAKTLEPLFKTFTMPKDADNTALAALEDLEITVVANAIQADGFANENAAWDAFN